jgi:hypothetical protein
MKKTLLIVSFLLISLSLVSLVLAQGYQTELQRQMDAAAGAQGANLGVASDPRMIAAVVINIILGLMGLLMTVYTVYAGFIMTTSGGNEEKMATGRNMIKNSVIGLVIIFSAYGIARTIEYSLKVTPQCTGFVCFSTNVQMQNVPANYYNPDVMGGAVPNIGIQ